MPSTFNEMKPLRRFRFGWKSAGAIILLLVLAVGGIGFLHTAAGRRLPLGRRLLGWVGLPCPLDRDLSAERVEASRQRGVSALRGNRPAPSRPALAGLRLLETTQAQAQTWASARGISCRLQSHGMHFLKCENVKPKSLPRDPGQSPIHMLTLAFGPRGHLVAVDLFRRGLSPAESVHLLQTLSARLTRTLGKPTDRRGPATEDYFRSDTMKVALIDYRFRDYLAMLM